MKIEIRKKFLIELSKIQPEVRSEIEDFIFEEFPANPSIKVWDNIAALKGNDSCKKIPFGDYRIGIKVKDNSVIFERIRHYHDIYRIQP